jgi:hypothetical protein
MAIETEKHFEAFLREWANERIWPMDDFLDLSDQQFMAERRAIELIQMAKETGFADSLFETVKGYGGVAAFVKHLMWEADFNAARSRGSIESGKI